MSRTTNITPNLTTNNFIKYNNDTSIKWTNLQNNSSYVKLIKTANEYIFEPSQDINCSVAIIGGGGAGNLMKGGGGGAGGTYISSDQSFIFRTGYKYKLKIGKGGSMIVNNATSIVESNSGLILKRYNFKITNNNVAFNQNNSNADKIVYTLANITNFNNIQSATNNSIIVDSNSITCEWLGYFKISSGFDGEYQFRLNSSDFSYLWIDTDGTTNTTTYPTIANAICSTTGSLQTNTSANLSMQTNTYYPIRILYAENKSSSYISYIMNSQIIPPTVVGGSIIDISGTSDSYAFFTLSTGINRITFDVDTVCDIVLVGGGGAGGSGITSQTIGSAAGGGGGAGEYVTKTVTLSAGISYDIIIGNGGSGQNKNNGQNTSLIGNNIQLYAVGGGNGGDLRINNGIGNVSNKILNSSGFNGGNINYNGAGNGQTSLNNLTYSIGGISCKSMVDSVYYTANSLGNNNDSNNINYTYFVYTTPGTYTIKFNSPTTISVILIGGGGAGCNAPWDGSLFGFGNGGYSGYSEIYTEVNVIPDVTYTIIVGDGGYYNCGTGGTSSFVGGNINYEKQGGYSGFDLQPYNNLSDGYHAGLSGGMLSRYNSLRLPVSKFTIYLGGGGTGGYVNVSNNVATSFDTGHVGGTISGIPTGALVVGSGGGGGVVYGSTDKGSSRGTPGAVLIEFKTYISPISANPNTGNGGYGGDINSIGGDGGSGVAIIKYAKSSASLNINFNVSFKGPDTNNEFIYDFTNYFYGSMPIYSYKYLESSESYIKEYDSNNILRSEIISYGGNNGNLSNTCLNIKPWAMYFAEDWNNNIIKDSSGNNRNATTSGTITLDSTSNPNFSFLIGSGATITFPQGSIPLNYTICTILKGKKLEGMNETIWDITLIDDWNKIAVKNDNMIINDNIISNTNTNNIIDSLKLNSGNWSLAFVIIWESILTNFQLQYLENSMKNFLEGIPIKNIFINNDTNKGGDSGYVYVKDNSHFSTIPTDLINTNTNLGGDGNVSINNVISDVSYNQGISSSETISNSSSHTGISSSFKCDANDFVESIQLYSDNNTTIFNSDFNNDLYYTGLGFTCGNGKVIAPYGSTNKIKNIIHGLTLKIYPSNYFNNINTFFSNPPNSIKTKDGITNLTNITNAIDNIITTNFNQYMYYWDGYIIVTTPGTYTFTIESQESISYLWILDDLTTLPTLSNYLISDSPNNYNYNPEVCTSLPQRCYSDSWTNTMSYSGSWDNWTYCAGFVIPQHCVSFIQGKEFTISYITVDRNTGEILYTFTGIFQNVSSPDTPEVYPGNGLANKLKSKTESGTNYNPIDIFNANYSWGDGYNIYYYSHDILNISCTLSINGTTCIDVPPSCTSESYTTRDATRKTATKSLIAYTKYRIKIVKNLFTDLNSSNFKIIIPVVNNIYNFTFESNSSPTTNITNIFSFGTNDKGFLSKSGNTKTLQCSSGKNISGFTLSTGGNNPYDNNILNDNISIICDYVHNVSYFNCISSVGGGGGGGGISINGYEYNSTTLEGGKGGDGFVINFDPNKNIYGVGGNGSSFSGINKKEKSLIANTGCGSNGNNNDFNTNSTGSDGIIIINVKQISIININVYNTNIDVLNVIYQKLILDNSKLYNFIINNSNDKILKYISDSFINSYGDSFQSDTNSLASTDTNIPIFTNIIKMMSNIYLNIYNLLLNISLYNEINFNKIILSNTHESSIDQYNKIIYLKIDSIKPISSFNIPFLDDGNLNIDGNINLPFILNKTDFTSSINTDYTDYNSSVKKFIINNFYNIFNMNSKNIISEIYYYYAFYNVIWFNLQFISCIYPKMDNDKLDSLNSLIENYTNNVLNTSTDLNLTTLNQIKTNSITNNIKNLELTKKIKKENIQDNLKLRNYNNNYNINSIIQNHLFIGTIIFTIIFTIIKIIIGLNFNTIQKIYALILLLIFVILITIYIYYYYVTNGIIIAEKFSIDYNITTINNYFQLINLYLNNIIIKIPAINNKKYVIDSYNTVNINNNKDIQQLNQNNLKIKNYQSSENIMKLDNNNHIYFIIYDNYVIMLGIICTILYLLYPELFYHLLIIYIILSIIIYFIYYYKTAQYNRTNITKKYFKF